MPVFGEPLRDARVQAFVLPFQAHGYWGRVFLSLLMAGYEKDERISFAPGLGRCATPERARHRAVTASL